MATPPLCRAPSLAEVETRGATTTGMRTRPRVSCAAIARGKGRKLEVVIQELLEHAAEEEQWPPPPSRRPGDNTCSAGVGWSWDVVQCHRTALIVCSRRC